MQKTWKAIGDYPIAVGDKILLDYNGWFRPRAFLVLDLTDFYTVLNRPPEGKAWLLKPLDARLRKCLHELPLNTKVRYLKVISESRE